MAVTAPPGSPLAHVQENWLTLLEAVKAGSRSVEAFLKECRPVEADEDSVILGFNYPFHKESVDNPKNRVLVEEAFAKVLVRPVHIRCVLVTKDTPPGASAANKDKSTTARDDAVVKAAEQMFNATVLAVEETEA
jgi:hypothetical protein